MPAADAATFLLAIRSSVGCDWPAAKEGAVVMEVVPSLRSFACGKMWVGIAIEPMDLQSSPVSSYIYRRPTGVRVGQVGRRATISCRLSKHIRDKYRLRQV